MMAGALLIALAALLWATTGIAAKFLFTDAALAPITLAFLRLAVALPFFFLLMQRERARIRTGSGTPPLRSMLLPLLALGFFQALYQSSYLVAVDLTGAGIATLIALCLAPILVALLAIPLLGERIRPVTLAALAAAITGTALLVWGDVGETGTLRIGGLLTAMLAALVYAGFTLTSRFSAGAAPVYTTAFLCFTTAAILLFPVVVWQGGFAALPSLSGQQWLLILYIGIVPTCIGYVSFFKGITSTPATLSSIIVTLEPLFVALLAWVLLGERLGTAGVTGAVILTLAVMVASRASHNKH